MLVMGTILWAAVAGSVLFLVGAWWQQNHARTPWQQICDARAGRIPAYHESVSLYGAWMECLAAEPKGLENLKRAAGTL
jgi:hypothetical protein